MALRSDDKIAVIRTTGGDKPEYFTLDDVNTFVSSEEDSRVTALETAVGAYDGAPSDLSTDVSGLQAIAPTVAEVAIATAATIDITHDAINTAGKFLTIGNKTYNFVASLTVPAVANEIKVADTVSNQAAYLKAAINGEAGAGTTYGTGTTAHTQVTASAIDGAKVTLSMKTKGTAGVAITHDDNAAYDIASPATTWSTPIVGTIGITGQIIFDSVNNKLYACVDGEKAIATDSDGWKYISFTG